MNQISKYISVCLLTALTFSCGEAEKKTMQDSVATSDSLNSAATVSAIQPLRPDISLMPWEGDLSDAIYWKDSRGENAVVISYKPQYFWADDNPDAKAFFPKDEDEETLSELTEIFATHYVLKAGEAKWTVFNKYHDFLFGCCDVYMMYQPASLQVLDADTNGTGEVLFMYNQTEGDGMIAHAFNGTMVLEIDQSFFTIKDETGLGIENMKAETPGYKSEARKAMYPDNAAYLPVMNAKWTELYKAKVEQDRAEVTEQNNVDEHGHEDHHH